MPNRSIPEIFTDVINQLMALMTKESQLARNEMSEKIAQAGVGIALIVGGAVLLTPALVILLQAAVSGLITSKIVGEPWAPLIVGGGVFVIGLILLLIGMSRLKAEALIPNKTIRQVQSDVRVVQQQTRESYEQQRAA
jgi:Putative Actinobacterial Holin-X, holin superfamily III